MDLGAFALAILDGGVGIACLALLFGQRAARIGQSFFSMNSTALASAAICSSSSRISCSRLQQAGLAFARRCLAQPAGDPARYLPG